MDQIYDNRYYSAGSREPSPRRARRVQLGGSAYAGADRSTQRPTSTSRPNAHVNTSADGPVRPARSAHASRPSAQTHDRSSRPSSRLSGSDFMRYANDNAVVKAIYDFTHGSLRPLFIGIVVALALARPVFFPYATCTAAKRSSDILAKQVEIRQQYNDELQKSVDKLLSEEGIKDAASEDLGLVMPGEKKIDVLGLDDDSDSSSSKKVLKRQKAEVAKEIEEVSKDAPWYIRALDILFGFNGVEGQTVVISGK